MSDQTIFNDPQEGNVNDVFADQLNTIVNEEGKPKYKDVPAALEALAHSQQFIETLKREKADALRQAEEYKMEAEKRKSVEDAVNRITGQNQDPANTKVDQLEVKGLDENKVRELISGVLDQKTNLAQQQDNVNHVATELVKKFGEATKTVIANRAKELGLTPEQLRDQSKSNPQMVLALFSGITPVNQNPSNSSLMTTPSQTPDTGVPQPKRKLISGGATTEELVDYWRQVRDHTYKKLGVTVN